MKTKKLYSKRKEEEKDDAGVSERKKQPGCQRGVNKKVSKGSDCHISRWQIESHLGWWLFKNKPVLKE